MHKHYAFFVYAQLMKKKSHEIEGEQRQPPEGRDRK